MSDAETPEAVFLPGATPEEFVPTLLSRGPWREDAQHGGAPAALLARCVEHTAGDGHRLARLTVEFLRPVPLTALTVHLDGRAGRSAGRWEATIVAGGRLVATARAVTVVEVAEPLDVPDLGHADPPPVGHDEELPRFLIPGMPDYPSFYNGGMAPRIAAGTVAGPGEATGWFTFRVPLVAGEPTPPAATAAAAADFCNGLSWVVPVDEFVFSNADVTLNLWREPVADRVGVAARTTIDPHGAGVATGRLFDTRGMIGHASQSLVVRRRR